MKGSFFSSVDDFLFKIKEYKLRKIKNKANGYHNFKRYRNQCLYAINKVERPSIEKLKK